MIDRKKQQYCKHNHLVQSPDNDKTGTYRMCIECHYIEFVCDSGSSFFEKLNDYETIQYVSFKELVDLYDGKADEVYMERARQML